MRHATKRETFKATAPEKITQTHAMAYSTAVVNYLTKLRQLLPFPGSCVSKAVCPLTCSKSWDPRGGAGRRPQTWHSPGSRPASS